MKRRLEANDLGCAIHTALRKCCDSTVTSLAYNLIYGADKEWGLFLKLLHHNISDTNNIDQMAAEAQSIVHNMSNRDIWPEDEELKYRGDNDNEGANVNMFQAMVLTFEMFDIDEWKAALYFCTE